MRALGAPMAVWYVSEGGAQIVSSPGGRQGDEEPLTLGDVVDAVLRFAVDSREAAVVIEDLLATGLVRLIRPGPSRDGRNRDASAELALCVEIAERGTSVPSHIPSLSSGRTRRFSDGFA